MLRVQRILVPCLLALAAMTVVSSAYATDYYLNNDIPFTASSVSTSDSFQFSVFPGRSYCLEIQTITGGIVTASQALQVDDADLDLTTSDRGEATPRINPIFIPQLTRASRKCFLAAGNVNSISSFRMFSTLSFSTGTSASTTIVQLLDSTLSGGFNTSVTNFNFLELTNNLNSVSSDNGVITGKITAKNVITDAVVLNSNFTVGAGDRIDISLHDAVGAGVFGIVTVVHNGPAGSLRGVVSQYRLVSTTPFDFEPVLQQQLLRATGLP